MNGYTNGYGHVSMGIGEESVHTRSSMNICGTANDAENEKRDKIAEV